jgi:hypothetical protein
MLTLFALFVLYGGVRAGLALHAALRHLPRRNEDLVLF